MKNPKNNPWNKRLPEHLPDKSLWEKISSEKSLEVQVRNLRAKLPVNNPKETLWAGIEKDLKKRKVIVLWSRITSVAAIFLIGIWGISLLQYSTTITETRYLQTNISQDLEKSIPQKNLIIIPENQEKPLAEETTQRKNFLTKTIEMEKPKAPQVQIEIPKPEILIAEVAIEADVIIDIPETTYESKKTIAVTWDKPDRRIKIDGFNVELTEAEIIAINDLNNRKKGKIRLHVNALTARLYEK